MASLGRAKRRRGGAGLATAAIASLVASACTTVLYKGPSRPSSQIAVLTSQDTYVDRVDHLMVREHGMGNYSRFEILPGEHALGISLNQVPGLFGTKIIRSYDYLVVCVELEAGHVYRTRPRITGDRWQPEVVDVTTNRLLDVRCADDPELATPVVAAAPPPEPAAGSTGSDASVSLESSDATAGALTPAGGAPPPPQPTPTAAVAATPAASEPVSDGTATAGSGPAPPPAPASLARPVAARAADGERPAPATVRNASAAAPGDAELSGRRTGSGLSLFCGIAFGGDDFVTASNGRVEKSLTAGGGVILGVNGMVTLLWLGRDSVGFGVGADVGIKYDDVEASNGSASITRFPIALTAHLLTNGSGGDHYFLLRGGVARDFGVHYRVSGIASIDADVDGTWGPTGALGWYKRSTDTFAWHVLGFFSLTSHVVGTEKISANAFGLTLGLHYNL